MSHLLDTVKRNGYIYKVYEDESPEDPRAWENMGYLQTVYHRDAGEMYSVSLKAPRACTAVRS